MFSYITLALATASSVSAFVIPRPRYVVPPTYDVTHLEPYGVYHERYVAIGCTGKQGSAFFDQCCHPLLNTQTLDVLPAQCKPGAPPSTVSAPSDSDSSGSDDGWCYEGDEDCECEDEDDGNNGDDSSSGTPTGTPTGEVFKDGKATFYYQGGVAGACGTVHSDSDYIAALPAAFYGDFGQQSSNCGRKIRVTRVSTGKTVDVIVADGCPTCEGPTCLDLSEAAFLQLGTKDEGVFPISYQFIS